MNPERPAAAIPRRSDGIHFAIAARLYFPGFASAGSSGSALIVVDASHSAPPAEKRFRTIPTHVVARRPTAGMSQKPVAMAPSAAPAVLVAYNSPACAAR